MLLPTPVKIERDYHYHYHLPGSRQLYLRIKPPQLCHQGPQKQKQRMGHRPRRRRGRGDRKRERSSCGLRWAVELRRQRPRARLVAFLLLTKGAAQGEKLRAVVVLCVDNFLLLLLLQSDCDCNLRHVPR